MAGYRLSEFTKEYKRQRMPNIRAIGGIYYGINECTLNQPFDFDNWQVWNCQRCKHDFITNKEETLTRLKNNKSIEMCPVQGDLILNLFENLGIPQTTFPVLGMNQYGIGTCALFEAYNNGESNG